MNDPRRFSTASYRPDLAGVIQRFRALAPDLAFKDDHEEVLTIVCDSLKIEEFAEGQDYESWNALRERIRDRFDRWIKEGTDWKPLARLIVEENRLLYESTEDFLRVVRLGASRLPAEVAEFMEEKAASIARNE